MKINEIKRMEEKVIRKEYVAEDGMIFYKEDECREYEKSMLFVVSNRLKRLSYNMSHNILHEDFSEDELLEVFDIRDNDDLELLKIYLQLKLSQNNQCKSDMEACFVSKDGKRNDYVFAGVTPGHEVMIFWDYEETFFWVYRDGSLNGFLDHIRERYQTMIKEAKEVKESD